MKSVSTAALAQSDSAQPQPMAGEPRFIPLQSEPRWNGCGQPAAVHACTLVKHRGRQVLTALRTTDDRARLYSWRINADGAVLCTGSSDVPNADVVQVELVRAQHYVTASRTADGALHLQYWDVSNTGAIYAGSPVTTVQEHLTWFSLLALAPDRLLTIGLSRHGRWHLTTWSVGDDAPRALAQQTLAAATGAMAATLLPPATAEGPLAFVTVLHSGPNRLRWLHWHCLPDGQLALHTQVEHDCTQVIGLALTTVQQTLVTVLHHANGQLQVITGWPTIDAVNAPTRLAQRVQHFAVGTTDDAHQLAVATLAAPAPTTVAQAAPPPLTLRCWQPTAQEWVPCGHGTLAILGATDLTLCNQPLDGNAPFLMAVATASGALQLVTWGDTLVT
ncbi:MAG: hypothetical protein KDE31_26015 [Caldilineaceae bacterium]|nr:hypothetical protein [Caldilineaceae bacterium]